MEFLNNNPFLADLVDVHGGAAQPPVAPQPRLHQQCCKLTDFWPSNPALWFARAEFNFEVSGGATERKIFMHTANALPYNAPCAMWEARTIWWLMLRPGLQQPWRRLPAGRLTLPS